MKKIKFLIFACLAIAFTFISTSLSAQKNRTGEHVKQKMAKKIQTLKKVDGNLVQFEKATPTSSTQQASIKSKPAVSKRDASKTYQTRSNTNKQLASLSTIQTTKTTKQSTRSTKQKRFTVDPAKRAERAALRRANANKIDKTALKANIKKLNQ